MMESICNANSLRNELFITMTIEREADWKTKLSEDWLAAHGFTKDDEGGGVWQLWHELFPLFIKRADSTPGVWVAEIDGTPWPVDIRVCGQVRDLCRALECPLDEPESPTKPKLWDKWIAAAIQHVEEKKSNPVLVDVEIYEYFDKPVRIVNVNVYHGGTEVTVEGRFGELATIDIDQLSLRQPRLKS